MLSDQIRILRQKALCSQEAFAQALGVASSTINRWETGKSRPNTIAMKNLKQFCKENGLSFEMIEHEWINFGEDNQDE